MQVILDSFFARPGSAPVGARRNESSGTGLVTRKISLFSCVILLSCCYFVTMSHWKHNVHLMSLCLCPHVVISLVGTSVYMVVLRQNKPFPGYLLSLCQNKFHENEFHLHFRTNRTYIFPLWEKFCRRIRCETEAKGELENGLFGMFISLNERRVNHYSSNKCGER